MNQTIEELNKRELEKCYVTVYFVKNKVTLINGKKTIYILYGTNMEGKRQYITTVIDTGEKKASEWYDIFQGLKKRKLEKIVYAILPNDKSIIEAIKLSFMDAEIIDSMEDEITKLKKYVPHKQLYELKKGIRSLYTGETEKDFDLNFKKFNEQFLTNEFIKDLLYKKMEKIKVYYCMSKEVRTLIFGFYFSSAIYDKLKQGSSVIYENSNDYLDEKLKAFNSTEMQISYTRRGWLEVINNVYLLKKNLLIGYM